MNVLNKYKPQWIHGYPSIISLISSLMLEQNLKLNYNVKWITTGAENLLENQTLLIEKNFGLKPVQHYGQEKELQIYQNALKVIYMLMKITALLNLFL